MKLKPILILAATLCAGGLATAATLKVQSRNFTSEPTMRRRVTLTLTDPGPVVASPWLIAGDSVAAFTDTNGISYFSNVLAASYRLDIAGSPGRSFPIAVADTNGLLDAASIVNSTNANASYYTAAQVDALISDVNTGISGIADGSLTTNKVDATFYALLTSTNGGGGVSASEVAAIMATNNAATASTATNWIGMTNYSASYSTRATNIIHLYGFSVSALNGDYTYSGGVYANGTMRMWLDGDGLYYVTNTSGTYQVSTLANTVQPTEWEDQGAGGTMGNGYFPTNSTSGSSYRDSANYPLSFRSGIEGTYLNLGPSRQVDAVVGPNYMRYGPQVNASGSTFEAADYPGANIAAYSITNNATFSAAIASGRSALFGSLIFEAASSLIYAYCTNADLAIISSEFGQIYNGNGVAAFISCGTFLDQSAGTFYNFIGNSPFTNYAANFSTWVGSAGLSDSSLYNNTYGSILLNTGASTNDNTKESFIAGPRMTTTNLLRSTLIGDNLKAINSTNAFLLGQGMTVTSNDVVKIGFPGWNLVLKTNSLNIVSNGVAINVLGGGAPAGDYLTNGSHSPTIQGSLILTNLDHNGSVGFQATALDDTDQPTSSSFYYTANGFQNGGLYWPGWVFTDPVFSTAGFVGTHYGSASGLTNFPATVNTNNGTLTGDVPLLGNGARGATNALNITMGNGLLTLNSTNVLSSSGSALNNVRMTNGAITADSLNLTGTFTAATQNVTGTLTAGTIASTTVGNTNAPAWFNATGQLTNAASTGSGAVVLSNAPTFSGGITLSSGSITLPSSTSAGLYFGSSNPSFTLQGGAGLRLARTDSVNSDTGMYLEVNTINAWNSSDTLTVLGNIVCNRVSGTNGVASYATPTVTPIASTGWTNIWSTNAAIVYFSATSCTWTNRQSDGTGIYTNETSATFNSQPVYLQPGERLNINGTSVTGIARKF